MSPSDPALGRPVLAEDLAHPPAVGGRAPAQVLPARDAAARALLSLVERGPRARPRARPVAPLRALRVLLDSHTAGTHAYEHPFTVVSSIASTIYPYIYGEYAWIFHAQSFTFEYMHTHLSSSQSTALLFIQIRVLQFSME